MRRTPLVRRYGIFLAALFFLAPVAARVLAAPKAAPAAQSAPATQEQILADVWQVVRMSGAELGYAHTTTDRIERDGKSLVRSVTEGVLSFGRLGQNIEIRSENEVLETEAGHLLSSLSVSNLSSVESKVDAVVEGGKIKVKTTNYGMTTESELPAPEELLGPYGIDLVRRRHMETPGATYTYKTFVGEMMAKVVSVEGKVIGPVEKEVLGEARTLIEIQEESDLLPGLVVRSWFDDEPAPVIETTPVAGGMETIRVSKERALSKEVPTEGAAEDILLALSIRSNVRLPYPYRTESALYDVTVKEGDPAQFAEWAASPPRQVVEKREGNHVVVRISKVEPAPGASYTIPYAGERDLKEYLAPNTWLQADDPVLAAAAKGAIGDEKDAWKAAKRLEHWVFEHIANKNMTVGFASAREVCDTGEGDCSEHAVLLAAVLRAVGIPSRISMGVVYFNGIFAGHAWTEAWIGEWIPLDATMARPFVSAMHFAFGHSSLADEGMDALMASGVAFGNVAFDILECTLDGRVIRFDASFRPYTVDGDVYRNELYGIELRKPSGWRFENLEESGFGRRLLEMECDVDGQEGQVEVETMALPYNQDFFSIADAIAGRAKSSKREPIEIGGREGTLLLLEDASGQKECRALVTVDELLIVIGGEYASDAELATIRGILASVKWIGEAKR